MLFGFFSSASPDSWTSGGGGWEPQAVSRTAILAAAMMFVFMMVSVVGLSRREYPRFEGSFGKRCPGRFAYVAGMDGKALLDAAVAGDRGQDAAAADLGGIDDGAAVGRETRRFVLRRIGQDLALLR